MKKVLSALFSIFVICVICVFAYFNQQFLLTQVNKLKGMYYVDKGDTAYRELQLNEAIRFYSKGLSLYPGHYDAWYNLGNLYVAYEDYQSALYAYSQAYKYNPKMAVARINYGLIASEKLGAFDDAISQYDNVINTRRKLITIPYVFDNTASDKENRAIAYYNRGVTYKLKALYTNDKVLKRKYYSKAIESYKQAVKINPQNYDAQFNLGLAYHAYGDYRRAGKCYCKSINLEPMGYDAHYNLAILLRRMGHYDAAYEEIDKAITLITALDGNSGMQEYVAVVLNDITRSLYRTKERRDKMQKVLDEEKARMETSHKKTSWWNSGKKDKKNAKKNKKQSKDNASEIIDGKVVKEEDLDDAMIKTFGKCPSIKYFDPNQKDFEYYEE